MTFRIGKSAALAAVVAMASAGSAMAEAGRSVFCVAVRTVPMLDQDNYVMGSLGPVYMTPNFVTDLPDEQLVPMWTSYVTGRHPVGYPSNPDDTCYPSNTRRSMISAQRGDIHNITVNWSPQHADAKPKPK